MTEENLIKGSDLFIAIRDLKTAIENLETDDYSFITSIGLRRRNEFEDTNSLIEKEIVKILNVRLSELENEFKEL